MRSSSRDASRSGGFSLIEVLFALAVVGLALGAAASVVRAGLMASATAGGADAALALAAAKLDAAGAEAPLRPGVSTGVAGRFEWRLSIAPAADREAREANLALFRIEARVAWRDGSRQRQVDLATVRLGPVPPP